MPSSRDSSRSTRREHGEITGRTTIRRKVPVDDYPRLQKRFAHLFGAKPDIERIAHIQALADRNVKRFGLVDSSVAALG